jgi:hypothetical protein
MILEAMKKRRAHNSPPVLGGKKSHTDPSSAFHLCIGEEAFLRPRGSRTSSFAPAPGGAYAIRRPHVNEALRMHWSIEIGGSGLHRQHFRA